MGSAGVGGGVSIESIGARGSAEVGIGIGIGAIGAVGETLSAGCVGSVGAVADAGVGVFICRVARHLTGRPADLILSIGALRTDGHAQRTRSIASDTGTLTFGRGVLAVGGARARSHADSSRIGVVSLGTILGARPVIAEERIVLTTAHANSQRWVPEVTVGARRRTETSVRVPIKGRTQLLRAHLHATVGVGLLESVGGTRGKASPTVTVSKGA